MVLQFLASLVFITRAYPNLAMPIATKYIARNVKGFLVIAIPSYHSVKLPVSLPSIAKENNVPLLIAAK